MEAMFCVTLERRTFHRKSFFCIFFITLHFTSSQVFSPLTNNFRAEERLHQLKEELIGIEFAQQTLSSSLNNFSAQLNVSTTSFTRLLYETKNQCLQIYYSKLRGFTDFRERLNEVDRQQGEIRELIVNFSVQLNVSTTSFTELLYESKNRCIQTYDSKLRGFTDFRERLNEEVNRQGEIRSLIASFFVLNNSTTETLRALTGELIKKIKDTKRQEDELETDGNVCLPVTAHYSFREIYFRRDRRRCMFGTQNPTTWSVEKKAFVYSKYNIYWVKYVTSSRQICVFDLLSSSSCSICSRDEDTSRLILDAKYACRRL